MAERRPVSALEIKQDVEGYSEMNDDAFARRFYADRAELEALGIDLKVEKPPEGYFEAELYTLPPENFYLPPIEFDDCELAALQTALALLDGRFAYAEPLRLALQQLSWGRPSPLSSPRAPLGRGRRHRLGRRAASSPSASPRSRPRSRGARRSSSTTTRSSATRCSKRKIDPYHLLFQGGQFYLVGLRARARATCASSGSRGSRTRSPTRPRPSTTSRRPRTSIPGAMRAGPTGSSASPSGTAADLGLGADRVADRARLRPVRVDGEARKSGTQWQAGSRRVPGPGVVFTTEYAQPRQLISWVLGIGEQRARCSSPPRSSTRRPSASPLIVERHAEPDPDFVAEPKRRRARAGGRAANGKPERERPGRHADPPRALRAARRAGGNPDPVRAPRQRVHAPRRSATASRSPSRSFARTSTC